MPYVVERHATFLIPSGSLKNADGLHLHIVATAPCQYEHCLLLTVSTIREGIWYDPTRTLEAGCHPFIKEPSYVNFAFSVVKKCASITKMVDGWVYHPKPDFPHDLTEYVLSGARESEMTPIYVLDYLTSVGL